MTELIDRYNLLVHEKNIIRNDADRHRRKVKRLKKRVENYTQAKIALDRIIELSQGRLKKQLEDIITTAIQSVFDRNIQFIFNMEKSAPMILEDGEEFSPKDEIGGSLIDIMSIALRVVLIMLTTDPPVRPILFADEPFKHSGILQKDGARAIKEISRESGVQFIIVTHSQDISKIADRHFHVTRTGRISKVIRRR